MKSKPKIHESTPDMFRAQLKQILNLDHELCRLAEQVDWERLDEIFSGLFPSTKGKPATPTRLIIGLFFLKSINKVSDEELPRKWVENPYWQYFCGEQYLQHKEPIDATTMSKWRKRLKESGCEKLLEETVDIGLKTRTIDKKDLKKVTVDTAIQEKAISYPTDAKLYQKARVILVKLSKEKGIELKQNYARLGKKAYFMTNRYARARQMRRARKQTKRLKTYLGRIYREILRKIENRPKLQKFFHDALKKTEKLLKQEKKDKNKIYSLHAPEVECIGKGKVSKPYEFGVKVSFAATHKHNFILGTKALHGNPYDGHTLKMTLDQVERIVGQRPESCFVDLGYRGHSETETKVWIARHGKNTKTRSIRKDLKRRNAIEPIIGHIKSESHFDRNYLKGIEGDKMNAIFSAIGFNLRQILRKLRIFWLYFWYRFFGNFLLSF
jgi:IS5 family transposase